MNIYNNGDRVYTVGDIERLERENDGLKTQVELLREAAQPIIDDYFNWMEVNDVDIQDLTESYQKVYDMMVNLNKKLLSAPAQCLTEIKAQAGQAGFMAGVECVTTHDESTIYAAEEYANQIRQQANGGGE